MASDSRPGRSGRRRHRCYATCLPGLEALVVAELAALGIRSTTPGRGGVPFEASTRQLYAANLHLATATRVLVRLGTFRARTFDELEHGAAQLPWHDHLPAGAPVELRVSSKGSRLAHTGAIAERLDGVLTDVQVARDGWAPQASDDGTGAQLVVVRVAGDDVTVSLDTSGEPLHHRSWRTEVGKAPLRPTLAAALLTVSGWERDRPLLDPFCGSGTIVIEAARRARGIPAGWGRHFAFADSPGFEPGTWSSVVAEASADWEDGASAVIVGTDRNDGAVAATRANAERAEVADLIEVRRAAVSNLVDPGALPRSIGAAGAGVVVTNPPYGRRIASGAGDLRNLYARTGEVLRETCPGWGFAAVVADGAPTGQFRVRTEEVLRTTSGGLGVRLIRGRIGRGRRAGSGDRPPAPGAVVDDDT